MPAGDGNEVRVVAQVFAKPENVSALRALLTSMLLPTRAEKGCVVYDLHEVVGDPQQFVFFEIWEDAAALDAHLRTAHFKNLERAQSLMSAPMKITKLREIPSREEAAA